jgi:hypothetical protein
MNQTDKPGPFTGPTSITISAPDSASCAAASGAATIHAPAAQDFEQPDTYACHSSHRDNTGPGNASPAQEQSPVHAQVRAIIKGTGCSGYAAGALFKSWMKLHDFLEERGKLTDRLEEIDPHELAEFGLYCWSSRAFLTDESDALVVALPMVRILLVNAGFDRTALTALTTDVHRVGVPNIPGGK